MFIMFNMHMYVYVHVHMCGLDLIKITQFCLKIYDLYRHPHIWAGVCMVGQMGGLVGEVSWWGSCQNH